MKDRLFDLLMPVLPKNDLSHMVGRLVHHKLPGAVGRKSVEWFAKAYNINLNEAELPITGYRTIGELFTRRLKPGVRLIGEGVVHPADSQITEAGVIEHNQLIQCKSRTYTATELIRGGHYAQTFDAGQFLTYYLCPTDYHRVHCPVDGEIIWSCHIPGELWPVNPWSVKSIDNLFAVNERVVVMIKTPRGLAALVMVAATNVGNMSFSFDSHISSQHRVAHRQVRDHAYAPPVKVVRGQELGVFHMGSTVVMLYEKGVLEVDAAQFRGRHVKMGQSLLTR